MATQPLVHEDADKKSDIQLTEEASEHLARNPPLKVMSSFIDLLRAGQFVWFTEEETLMSVTLAERMKAIGPKHLRQVITSKLTGAKPKMAREWPADQQTEWIMQAIQSGDTTIAETEGAFDAKTLVVYMDAGRFWKLFRERMPWADSSPEHKHLVGSLLELFLAHKILTPLNVRMAIHGKVWHTHIPLELRIEIDDALLERERETPGMPYHADDILRIVGSREIAEYIPLVDLQGIMDKAEAAMGFSVAEEAPKPDAPAVENESVETLDEDDPDVTAALQGEAEEVANAAPRDPDVTQAFHISEIAKMSATATVDPGAFAAAIERSSPSSRRPADLERSSSSGSSASTIKHFASLEQAGFTFEDACSMKPEVAQALRKMLVDREWPLEPELVRPVEIVFMRAVDPNGPSEEELGQKTDHDLESRFFRTLLRVGQQGNDLVKALRLSKSKVPPAIATRKAATR